jgi:hypothetical protein
MTPIRRITLLIVCCLCATPILGRNAPGDEIEFQKDIYPVLQSHCFRCHGPDKQEGSFRLDNLSTSFTEDRAATEFWHEVLNAIQAGEMPPPEEPQLSSEQIQIVTDWLTQSLKQALDAQRQTDGRVVLRRLNRVEYQNTLQELLGLDMDYARDLPPDALSADGFRNNGQSLQMSSLQLEFYLSTARMAMDRVIVRGDKPAPIDHTFEASNLDDWLGDAQRSNQLGRKQEFLARMVDNYPEQGDFVVRVHLKADIKPNTGYPLLEVSVGYRPDTELLMREFALVEVTSPDLQTFEFRGRLENFPLPVRGQSKYPGLVVRVRNAYDDKSPLPKEQKDDNGKRVYPVEVQLPTLLIQSVEFHGHAYSQWPPPQHRQILFEAPDITPEDPKYIREVIARFMTRAFRRDVTDKEVSKFVDFFQSIRPEYPSFEEAIRETLSMVLIQPDFLFLVEPAGDEKREITEFELASRLSHFLWSSMPDEPLLQHARLGTLRQSLSTELDRMLADPKAERFVQQFTDQWLRLNYLENVAVNKEKFPAVDDRLKQEMRRETQSLFAEILKDNLSITRLLDCDFMMLNEPLAKHYGLEGVYGTSFRRVPVPKDSPRGGLLTQASFLLSHSTGSDSHPVRRAVWIRDRLLNDPPAPPPPNVPTLEQANPEFHKLSVREQLEIHRTKESCNQCHRNLDPWGIALENFDAVGRWRTEITRHTGDPSEKLTIDANVTLPNGDLLSGTTGLKNYLLQHRKENFARSLVNRLLSYSLGRSLDLTDQAAIDQVITQAAIEDYKLRSLVHALVMSEPFQTK